MNNSLVDFVKDLAENGLRFDLNPTVQWRDEESLAQAYLDYIKRIDESIRHRACAALVAFNNVK